MLPQFDQAHPSGHSNDAQAFSAIERRALRLLIAFGVVLGAAAALWAIAQMAA